MNGNDALGRAVLAAWPSPRRRARRARRRRGRRRPARRTWRSPRRRPTSRPATSTSTTCSRRAATPARSTSTACRRCATSRTIPVFTPYPATGYGFDDEVEKMLGGFTWGDVHHPGALGNQRRLRRPLAVRQRHERPRRAHRPARLQDQADPRPDAERLGQPRVGVRHAEHRVRDGGVALLGSAAQGHASRRSRSTPPSTRASSRRSRSTRRAARCRSAGRS